MTNLQAEPGKSHRPMRPMTLIPIVTSKSLVNDPSPVDWTVAGTKIPITSATSEEFFDDNGVLAIDDANDEIDLPPGIWLFDVCMSFVNSDAGDESLRLAITNAAGSTVYRESVSFTVDAGENRTVVFRTILHLTEPTSVCIRGAQVSGAGTDLSVVNGDRGILIQKIGNANQA